MAISKIKTGSITDSAITTAKINSTAVTEAKLGTGAVTSAKISDGTIANADVSPTAAIASSKLTVDTSTLEQNISLLGFKMAVNEGLTVFNLVDGVVDEFHDESGTDEAEGSNDQYCATSDFYQNITLTPATYSAGFSTTAVTEEDTSEAGTNPTFASGTFGQFTVPTGMTSVVVNAWGAGGKGAAGNSPTQPAHGGGGGFAQGTVAVTAGQVLEVIVGEGGGPTQSEALGGGGTAHSLSYTAGGLSGVITNDEGFAALQDNAPKAPQVYVVAGGGGAGGHTGEGGAGGGLTGCAGGQSGGEQTSANTPNTGGGGGGDQEQGGQGQPGNGQSGAFFDGGDSNLQPGNHSGAGGGGGFYGGGAGTRCGSKSGTGGGGGSSYYGNPAVTSGSTEEGNETAGGGTSKTGYVAGTNEGNTSGDGEDGYILLTGTGQTPAPGGSSTIVSTAFAAGSVPTTSRIVVFQENVDTPTLNTDIIASISRDGGSNFTTATLSDSGYVTGSSGQRILTGQATISGQPSGQSMRWKLALANNTVKIHGVSLQWA